jgi:hypothetical protein
LASIVAVVCLGEQTDVVPGVQESFEKCRRLITSVEGERVSAWPIGRAFLGHGQRRDSGSEMNPSLSTSASPVAAERLVGPPPMRTTAGPVPDRSTTIGVPSFEMMVEVVPVIVLLLGKVGGKPANLTVCSFRGENDGHRHQPQ